MALTLDTAGKLDRSALAALCADAITELERACARHPRAPDRLLPKIRQPGGIADHIARVRACNDGRGGADASAYSVATEEILEFFDAAARGDAAEARAELVQAMAMLMRAYVHLGEYCKN